MPIDIAGAEKKLRQAEFFLAHLQQAAQEICLQMRRAAAPNPELLEYWFSACLSSAQSVYFVLKDTGGTAFRDVQKAWRAELGKPAGDEFGWISGVRGRDVHFATIPGSVLSKTIPASGYEMQWYSGGLPDEFGAPAKLPVLKNPDGSIVDSPVTVGSLGLYIDTPTQEWLDAEDLCRRFIGRLHALLARVEAELA
jgi:hypothetical protein